MKGVTILENTFFFVNNLKFLRNKKNISQQIKSKDLGTA